MSRCSRISRCQDTSDSSLVLGYSGCQAAMDIGISEYQRFVASAVVLMNSRHWDTQDVALLQDGGMSGYCRVDELLWDIRVSRYQRFVASAVMLMFSQCWDTQDITLLQDIGIAGYQRPIASSRLLRMPGCYGILGYEDTSGSPPAPCYS